MDPSFDARKELRRLESELRQLRARLEPATTAPAWRDTSHRFALRVGADRFAIRLDEVLEVVPMCQLAPYPEAPPWVAGLLNLHGALVPVLDLGARIHRRERTVLATDFIVATRYRSNTLGLVVTEACGVEPARADELQRVTDELPHAPYVVGYFESSGQMTFALNLEALLATSDLPETP